MSHFVQGIIAGVIAGPITFTIFVILPEVRHERRWQKHLAEYRAKQNHPSNYR